MAKRLNPPRTRFFVAFIAVHGWPATDNWKDRSHHSDGESYSKKYREFRGTIYENCPRELQDNDKYEPEIAPYWPLVYKQFFKWTVQERKKLERKKLQERNHE